MNGRNLTRRLGFSLIELLVVVSIIVMLVALLVPALQGVRDAGRHAVCSSNMHQIVTGFQKFKFDKNIYSSARGGGSRAALSAYTWHTSVLRAMGDGRDVFLCPMDAKLGVSSVLGMKLEVYSGGAHLHDMPLEPGTYCIMVDNNTPESVWSRISGMSQGHVDSLANGVYEFYFEDLRPPAVNDWDFEDVVLRVEEAVPAPGQLTVTFVSEGAGYWFNLIDNSGNVIMANMDDGSAAPSPRTPTGTSEVIDGTFASYGMNRSWVETKNPHGEMIFIMDYVTTAAWGGHLGYYDTWADWIDIQGKHRFARHAGSANVVFMDGAVQQYDTAVIDPVLEINRLRYWLPQDAENPEFPN